MNSRFKNISLARRLRQRNRSTPKKYGYVAMAAFIDREKTGILVSRDEVFGLLSQG